MLRNLALALFPADRATAKPHAEKALRSEIAEIRDQAKRLLELIG